MGGKDVGHPLDAIQLAHERSKGFITALPLPTEDDIKDKSKTNVFAKAIAVILIFRLVISLVAGAVLGLSISQMKIITYRVYRLYNRDLWFLVEETSSNRDPYATYCIFRQFPDSEAIVTTLR
jgi:hypothetical protein